MGPAIAGLNAQPAGLLICHPVSKSRVQTHKNAIGIRRVSPLWFASSFRRYAVEKSNRMSATCDIYSCADPEQMRLVSDLDVRLRGCLWSNRAGVEL